MTVKEANDFFHGENVYFSDPKEINTNICVGFPYGTYEENALRGYLFYSDSEEAAVQEILRYCVSKMAKIYDLI